MNTAPILYIEDEEDYQILVRRILEKAGFQVMTADSGVEGLAALRTQKPPLLLLDINLPDANGYELCSELRKDAEWQTLPIVMLTVRRRPDEWIKGFTAGADDYVPKPLDPPELVGRVRACLNGESRRSQAPEGGEFGLIQAAVGGNRAAFEVLIQKYRDRLIENMRTVGNGGFDTEDLVSIVFIRAYERLNQFRGQSSFYTWLYRIALNESYRLGRKGVGISLDEITAEDESALAAEDVEPNPLENDQDTQTRNAQIEKAVSAVPKPYRQMLDLHINRGLSYEDMARRLDIPQGTVMSRLFKARKLLRQAWDRQGKE